MQKGQENVSSDKLSEFEELIAAVREENRELEGLVIQLASPPLSHGMVIRAETKVRDKRAFEPNDRVMIRNSSAYRSQCWDEGTVIGPMKNTKHNADGLGWVRVRFDNGYENDYPNCVYARDAKHIRNGEDGKATLERVQPQFDMATVLVGGSPKEVLIPDGIELKVGYTVLLGKNDTIVSVFQHRVLGGPIYTVKHSNGEYIELDAPGGKAQVMKGEFTDTVSGDRVILDSSNSIVVKNLGKSKDSEFLVKKPTGVSWDDIGGQELAKKELREAVELPYQHLKVYQEYGVKPVKGILLYGPPGCGKTMLAKAAATAVAKANKSDMPGFINVKGPEVLIKWVGESEETIRNLFRTAERYKEETGVPAIIFIDEADAILNKRGSGRSSDVDRTIVPAFLTEMDGLNENAAIVILATNRHDTLDTAVLRDGRVDRRIKIARPGQPETATILGMNLKKTKLAKGLDVDEVATLVAAKMFDENEHILSIKTNRGVQEMLYHDFLNGAMIVGVVERAVKTAMRRDMQAGKAHGVLVEDLMGAVAASANETRQLDQKDTIEDYAANEGVKVEGVKVAKVKE